MPEQRFASKTGGWLVALVVTPLAATSELRLAGGSTAARAGTIPGSSAPRIVR
jgi:hypothetical protein